jgi:small subunit ribosomal protein S1
LRFGITDGQRLGRTAVTDVLRHMLREEFWCRLENPGRFYLHTGYDYYVYLGTDRPTPRSVDYAASTGLFLDQSFPSPYWPEEGDPTE